MTSECTVERPRQPPTASQPDLPHGWRGGPIGDRVANYAYGSHIELDIEPRYSTRSALRDGRPGRFRVLLRKRFYGPRVSAENTVVGTTATFDEAIDLAHAYMSEFVTDRREVAMETRAELESDPVMATEAEETIISEAATEAAIDVAGYSDELLINDLRGLLETGESGSSALQAVVHRDGRAYDTVFVAEGFEDWGRAERLRAFYKQFDWLDEQQLATTLAAGKLTLLMGVFDETRMIRYLASEDEETLILIDPRRPLHVPPFERQIADIVSAKWEQDEARG
jgi:hypothetical protein